MIFKYLHYILTNKEDSIYTYYCLICSLKNSEYFSITADYKIEHSEEKSL
jgi:hypothetical protein